MASIINLEKYQKIDITKKSYKEIPLINQINIALYHIYGIPMSDIVLIHFPEGPFTNKDNLEEYLTQIKTNRGETSISSTDELVLNHFIITQEVLSKNSIVLGFFHTALHSYNRYKIKNIIKLCELLRVMRGDFSQILGKASPDDFKIYNSNITKKRYLSEISSLISSASFIPIQNEHIFEMLKYFNIHGGNICPLPKIQ